MILIYSTDHEPAPYLDTPLIEQNADRRIRPIFRKMRKVRGKTGWILRRYGYILGAPKDDPVGLAHHAVQIGDYVYELTREKFLVGQRLTGHQIWPSTVGHLIIGYTDMSDEDIQMESLKAQAYVRGRFGGKYHIKHNNCQTFINEFLRRIMTMPLDYSDSEASSLSDTTLACTEKRSLEITTSACSSSDTLAVSEPDTMEGKSEVMKPSFVITVAELPAPAATRRASCVPHASSIVTTSMVSACA